MSVSLVENHSSGAQVAAGEKLVLRVSAFDPNGISKIFIQCFQFSMGNTNKAKLAAGELLVPQEEAFARKTFEVTVIIPENAALGKWGVQTIEFTNLRGYKSCFYRGHDKFDNLVFEVVPPPSKEDELLHFSGVEFGSRNRCA
ncbi:MAG TPA: hypothetical protein VKA60_21915 [Blastocatellia bacterium]|nr:hypothetical protein [Blastocatellia bacterium]